MGKKQSRRLAGVNSGKGAAGKSKGKKGAGSKGGDEQAKMTRGEDSCLLEITVPVESPKLMMLEVRETGRGAFEGGFVFSLTCFARFCYNMRCCKQAYVSRLQAVTGFQGAPFLNAPPRVLYLLCFSSS